MLLVLLAFVVLIVVKFVTLSLSSSEIQSPTEGEAKVVRMEKTKLATSAVFDTAWAVGVSILVSPALT